jgi:hypothetical protein
MITKRLLLPLKLDLNLYFSDKLLDYMHSKNVRGFWAMWRSHTRNVQDNVSHMGTASVLEAADALARKFKTNFVNSADNTVLHDKFIEQLNSTPNVTRNFVLDVELVERSLLAINDSSCLDVHGLCKFHVLYAHEVLRAIIARLYSAFMLHCFVPSFLTKVVLMPLVKDMGKNLDDVNNYRPIAIAPIFAKIFESCISVHSHSECEFLNTHNNQLGFVSGGGCSRAICALKTVIQYFLENKSSIFLCALDAKKAFDRINHFGLLTAYYYYYYYHYIICIVFNLYRVLYYL